MERIRIVLCRPSHPGNIGSAARAMKTMGLADLRLVSPQRYGAKEDQWMATHAQDVLQASRVHDSLGEAIEDCAAAFALTARPREWSPQVLDVRAAARRAAEIAAARPDAKVAFVFGSEDAGLTNEEMIACQYLVHIPSNPGFSSLNLAQAVQVAAYELFMTGNPQVAGRGQKQATVADREGLYAHLEEATVRSGFYVPSSGSRLPERLRRMFSRIPDLEREEVNIVRGLLKALLKQSEKP